MTAIAGLWTFGARGAPDAERSCQAMLAAQRAFGPDASAAATVGNLCLGRTLFRLVPEDAFDRQPLVSTDRRSALVADVRLDNRAEIASALGIAAPDSRELADAELLHRALQHWDAAAIPRLLGDFA